MSQTLGEAPSRPGRRVSSKESWQVGSDKAQLATAWRGHLLVAGHLEGEGKCSLLTRPRLPARLLCKEPGVAAR